MPPSVNDVIDTLRMLLCRQHSHVEWDSTPGTAQRAVNRDAEILEKLAMRARPATHIRVWQNEHCLVVPRRFGELRGFRHAVRRCRLPVALRSSSGTAVVHGPHIVNVTALQIAERSRHFTIDGCFAQFGEILQPVWSGLGLDVTLGPVRHAHCDGRFNFCCKDRKLGGTAAFVKYIDGLRAYAVHASISVTLNGRDLEDIMSFERQLGMAADYRHCAHTSLLAEMEARILKSKRITAVS